MTAANTNQIYPAVSRHNISRASQLFRGQAQLGVANNGKVGARMTTSFLYQTQPTAAVANGYCLSQSVAAGASALLNGSLAGSFQPNIAVLTAGLPDIPRNVVGAWTGASTITVVGQDFYGRPQTEVQTGTSFAGKKAFSVILSITSSAAITLATFGTGIVLGLPQNTPAGNLLQHLLNSAADAGAFVPADATTPATSATGDVMGTYAPAGTLNGTNFLTLEVFPPSYDTALAVYGVTPA